MRGDGLPRHGQLAEHGLGALLDPDRQGQIVSSAEGQDRVLLAFEALRGSSVELTLRDLAGLSKDKVRLVDSNDEDFDTPEVLERENDYYREAIELSRAG